MKTIREKNGSKMIKQFNAEPLAIASVSEYNGNSGLALRSLHSKDILAIDCQENRIDTYQAKATLSQAEKMVEGLPISASEYLNILNIEGLNDFPPEKFLIVLKTIDDFFKYKGYPKNKYPLRVFYGFKKLTKKIVKKPSVIILYENGCSRLNDKYVHRTMKVIYQRVQTYKEKEDAKFSNRLFSKYEYFINGKIWKGDIDAILRHNFFADKNNIPIDERELIRGFLKKEVFDFYGDKISKFFQSSFDF